MESPDATPPPPTSPGAHRRGGAHPIRRVALVVLAILVAFIGWHVAQVWLATHALDQQLQSYAAAGEATTLADLRMPAVGDEHNGALLIRRAADSLNVSNEEWNAIDALLRGVDPTLDQRTAARKAVQDNFQALSSLHEARALAQTDWQLQFGDVTDLWRANQGFVPEIRLADLLSAAAIFDHEGGNDEATVDDLRDLIAFANHVDAAPGMLAHLTAISILRRATQSVERLSPTLATGRPTEAPKRSSTPGQPYTVPIRPASMSSVQHLIAELLDESSSRARLAEDLKIERIAAIERARALANGSFVMMPDQTQTNPSFIERLRLRLSTPMILRQALATMNADTSLASAAIAKDYASAKALMPAPAPPPTTGFALLDSNLKLMTASDAEVRGEFEFSAERRMAGLALALRLWANDHDGMLAVEFKSIVPQYLPALPEDPFDNLHSIGYITAPPQRLYSVGLDGNKIYFHLTANTTDGATAPSP